MELWQILVMMIGIIGGVLLALFGGMWAIIHYISKQYKDLENLKDMEDDD